MALGLMKRVAALALALFLIGCGPSFGPLTGVPYNERGGGCFTNHADGPLVVDPTYGTAIVDSAGGGSATAVVWRPGFTARRVRSEIEVEDSDGHMVAITGKRYRIDGGYQNGDQFSPGLPAVLVFWACDRVTPLDP